MKRKNKSIVKHIMTFILTVTTVLGTMSLPPFKIMAQADFEGTGEENTAPSVMGIPGESIDEGKKFAPIKLDKYVTDDKDKPEKIKWSVSGNKQLKVNISRERVATIEIPNEYWNGSEDITFIAKDTRGAVGSETVNFNVESVNNPPEVEQIPDQTRDEGKQFANIRLDDYVFDPDHAKNRLMWEFDITPTGEQQADGNLYVEIDSSHVASVVIPDPSWYGSCKIKFTATDPDCASSSTTATFVVKPKEITYIDENCEEKTVADYTVLTPNNVKPDENGIINLTDGWYVVRNSTTISDRINVSGTVNLVLCDGKTLTADKGIGVGSNSTFNVYAQSDNESKMGTLVATADSNSKAAGIGGGYNSNFGTININGGKIIATGSQSGDAAGIGGGYRSDSGDITINGGIVEANAGDYSCSAGIGGGKNGYVSNVILNGGTISATGDKKNGGAGIGTGLNGGNGMMNITISSGDKRISATKGDNSSDCIGKGSGASTTVNVIFKHNNTEVTGDAKNAVLYDSGEGASSRTIRGNVINHSITISDDIKANINSNVEVAPKGETVTLTLGAFVDASTLRVNDGTKDLTLTDIGNGQYTFIMTNADATVTAKLVPTYAVVLPDNMEIVSTSNIADNSGKYISGTTVTFKVSFPYEVTSNVSDGTNTLTADENGNYSVAIDKNDITITADTQMIKHQHNFTYSTSGTTITATCSTTVPSCELTNGKATLTLSAVDAMYNGNAYTGAGISDKTAWTAAGLTIPMIEYEGRGKTSYTKTTTAPTNAGTYIASMTVDTNKTVTVDFEITKVDPDITAPTAESGLIYSGLSHKLVTEGSSDEGTMQYAIGKDATNEPTSGWSESIPEKTDAGTYYVWYRVVGDDNHKDTVAECVTVTITKETKDKPTVEKKEEPQVDKKQGEPVKQTETPVTQTSTTQAPAETKVEVPATDTSLPTTDVRAEVPATGTTLPVTAAKAEVKVTSKSGDSPSVTYKKTTDKKAKNIDVTDNVTVDGVTYEVTSVEAEAFKGSNATSATLGKNITKIEPKAFKGSKIKTVVLKSSKLTKKSVKNAFKGIKVKKVVLKVNVGSKKENKKYVKLYKKIFTKKNVGVKVVVK